ncbi:sigma factor-like helix-turn-helix DNA-binding protein [Actinomadura rubrisoli]|uniref:sigma factor-like helix-turn-helix DNA-binding protein n=1 Tax=Actinomadura rubrisoli TaxID=2530368 RepID=UPI001A9CE875|nr:sigma factor-like helix-turn-helix DNA-binding protein [Actinomadura rubrisoli]
MDFYKSNSTPCSTPWVNARQVSSRCASAWVDYGVTRERIRQIEGKALKKLRHPSRTQVLEPYYYAGGEKPKPRLTRRKQSRKSRKRWPLMAKKRFDAEIPNGQHLGVSCETDGAYRGHLFDDETGQLVGHVELIEVDEDHYPNPPVEYIYVDPPKRRSPEYDALVELGSQMLTHYIDRAVARWAPPAKQWLRATARPALQARIAVTRGKWQNRRRAEIVESVRVDASTEVAPAEAPEPRTGSTDARKRLLILLVASAIVEQWQEPIEAMSPQEVEDRIARILEHNPSWLDEFVGPFEGGRVVDKEQVLQASERINEALRLPSHEL